MKSTKVQSGSYGTIYGGTQNQKQVGNPAASAIFTSLLQKKRKKEEISTISEIKLNRQKIDALWLELDKAEEHLASNPTYTNFLKYQAVVRAIGQWIMKKAFKQRTYVAKDKQALEFIEVINEDLASLLHEITRRNIDVLIALKLMGRIKGLLLDASA
ncbi:MAG: DUF327 family protein [Candidatus Hydrogenedentota bacterium]|nr:MAG: DUF327 family protein [Candidatus Hydrogenedentota bacterium]